MTSLDQIQALDSKIQHIMQTLSELRRSNDQLTVALQQAEGKNRELEQELAQLRTDHAEIEATINRTLLHLDALEQGSTDAASAGDATNAGDAADGGGGAQASDSDAAGEAAAAATAAAVMEAVATGGPSAEPANGTGSGATAASEGSELDIF